MSVLVTVLQPSSPVNLASLNRARGVSAAMAWGHERLVREAVVRLSTSQPEAFTSAHQGRVT